MVLTAQERQEINELAQQFETATGAQAVAAVIGKADDYPDIPWKAFALGAALAALAVVADEFIHPDWASIHAPLTAAVMILEVSGDYPIALPLIVAAVVSTLVSRALGSESVYETELRKRGLGWDITLEARQLGRDSSATP